MPDTADFLRLEKLQVHFPIQGGLFDRVLGRPAGTVRAVDGIDLDVGRGEIVALVGESGSGKTTVGRVITKLAHPTGGRLLFEGHDMTSERGASALRPYRHRVQMIFQDAYQALNPRHTVFDIVAEPLRSLRLVKNDTQLAERVSEALASAGLNPPGDFFARFPHELSGGQRQRVVIAGALAVRPELIVADEPVSMLDVSIRSQILQVLVDLRDKHNMALLFITHDLPLAWLIADRIAVLYLGRLVEIGRADDITFNPRHPYTVALSNATPKVRVGVSHIDLPALEGEVPSAARIPKGCRFHPRCPMAIDRCRQEDPPAVEVGPQHMSACWRAGEVKARSELLGVARSSSVEPLERRLVSSLVKDRCRSSISAEAGVPDLPDPIRGP
ncbi:MAG: ABC transporter ATP-binding protein [Mesorhizobium sp.]|uniref:ABC transporter ATP-binding protein n=1 Tax=Mesorhizobium sp. TaxID=1871066 RepID=UPI000FE9536A|nr:ABC transporter ATP-binding protein [Mesorhizobium sp.]RWH18720.1 MAG: ABC transporter ATP-binding protein [Mesorhizobium sp.]RWH34244.1 MAG: ABC transporter ATP-binding protein [Mesorhizobium sp.]TIM70279.1 MAG: ABC transporter ATP-binding protein [Mesorhizobium sp.]TIO04471.1 MAG: ABC transporter ATP-binding protein [Mesorhizobium sp.]TIR61867.1 MAG: ABC transporter ATP-binding protein [Mesorhizobium sp.]